MIFFICDTRHDKHQCYSRECALERNTDLSRPPGTLKTRMKNTLSTHASPFACRQGLFDISVTGVFIEQRRASFSPSSLPHEPIPAQTLSWQPCSLTGKAIMSAHWHKIACCANRFLSPVAEAEASCSSLCSDSIHTFFDALLHSAKTICIKMSVSFFFQSNTDVSFC